MAGERFDPVRLFHGAPDFVGGEAQTLYTFERAKRNHRGRPSACAATGQHRGQCSGLPGLIPCGQRGIHWRGFRVLQLVQKFFKQIGRNVAAIFGGRANVVDGQHLGQQCPARRLNDSGVDRFTADGVLGAIKAGRVSGKARSGQTQFSYDVVLHDGGAGECNLGDGHGATGSNLAQILVVLCEAQRNVNREEQFIGGEGIALVAGVKLGVRHAARAADRDQFNLGIVDQQGGRRIGSRRTVDKIAAKGGAALIGDGADPARGFGNEGKICSDGAVCTQIAEGCAGPNE